MDYLQRVFKIFLFHPQSFITLLSVVLYIAANMTLMQHNQQAEKGTKYLISVGLSCHYTNFIP